MKNIKDINISHNIRLNQYQTVKCQSKSLKILFRLKPRCSDLCPVAADYGCCYLLANNSSSKLNFLSRLPEFLNYNEASAILTVWYGWREFKPYRNWGLPCCFLRNNSGSSEMYFRFDKSLCLAIILQFKHNFDGTVLLPQFQHRCLVCKEWHLLQATSGVSTVFLNSCAG